MIFIFDLKTGSRVTVTWATFLWTVIFVEFSVADRPGQVSTVGQTANGLQCIMPPPKRKAA